MNTNQKNKSQDCNYTGKTYQQECLHLKQRSRLLYINQVMNASVRCYRNTSGNHQHQMTVIRGGEKETGKQGKRQKKEKPNHHRAPKYNEFLSIITTRKAHEWLGRLLVMVPKSSRSRSSGFTERDSVTT